MVNLHAADAAEVPLDAPYARLLAAWDDCEPPGADGVLRLPPESAAVLAAER
ncbi:hypothetical protein [Streptomyces sp. Ru87]|uniref:hypothetical protein n=1 Tax=Streptomyces sp. Ru87 TaxID=2044307 RepID=UPI0015D4CBB7|nr:hypothetical protein [Streptomyces sp. Ru87]